MANPSPMTSPVEPPRSEPMPRNRAPSTARRTAVFSAFLILFLLWTRVRIRYPCNARHRLDGPGRRASVVVPGVDVDARDALGAEHLDVATVVLDRQLESEAELTQIPDRRLLEV